jgi:hypothetical protein
MRVAFLINELAQRGTQATVWHYARANELAGNTSLIVTYESPEAPYSSADVTVASVRRFTDTYATAFIKRGEIDGAMADADVDVCFAEVYGNSDELLPTNVPTLAHCVFEVCHEIGTMRVAISDWLARRCPGVRTLPNVVHVDPTTDDLRAALGIPEDAVVFGRHGGLDTFDFECVRDVVRHVAVGHPSTVFLFVNTTPFCIGLDNVIFLEGTCDDKRKREFINTCDAMLHARKMGESFGIAVGEFAVCGKPVVTTDQCRDRAHIEMLGDEAILYRSPTELVQILTTYRRGRVAGPTRYHDCTIDEITPSLCALLAETVRLHKRR